MATWVKQFSGVWPPWVLTIIGIVWAASIDKVREWALHVLLTQYTHWGPLACIALGGLWSVYASRPRFDIVYDPANHPFRQEWDDKGGHQILFRVGVRNLSHRKAVNRAEVRLTKTDPYMMACIPARLLLMNEERSAREFFLPPGGIQYVDVIQQNSNALLVWHTVTTQEVVLKDARDYDLTITVFGDNATAVSRIFTLRREGAVFTLHTRDEE